MNDPFLIAGIVILTAVLLRLVFKWYRSEARRKAEQQIAAQKARKAVRRKQTQLGEEVKAAHVVSRVAPERVPLSEPYDKTFTGGATPQSIAKWEAEIHQVGRQMIGQLDSKMVALQTLTLEANRAANRLEILVEHLEKISKLHPVSQVESIRSTAAFAQFATEARTAVETAAEPTVPSIVADEFEAELEEQVGEDPFAEFYAENFRDHILDPEREPQIPMESVPHQNIPTRGLIPVEQAEAAAKETGGLNPLSAVLGELDARAQVPIPPKPPVSTRETVAPAMVLKTEPSQTFSERQEGFQTERIDISRRFPDSIGPTTGAAGSSPGPIRKKLSRGKNSPLSLGSPAMPGGNDPAVGSVAIPPVSVVNSTSRRITVSPGRKDVEAPLSMETLYDDGLAQREGGELFAVAGVATEAPVRTVPPELGSHLELRRQVELLSDYGYTPRQIAQSLDITVGEVDLVLNLRR